MPILVNGATMWVETHDKQDITVNDANALMIPLDGGDDQINQPAPIAAAATLTSTEETEAVAKVKRKMEITAADMQAAVNKVVNEVNSFFLLFSSRLTQCQCSTYLCQPALCQ